MDNRLSSAVVFLSLWAVYVHAAAPGLMPGDSAELAAAASSLGIAHSPGYPLFSLGGKIFSLLTPWGNASYRMNLFSGFALALGFAVLARVWATGGTRAVWVPILLAGLSPLCVTLAGAAEVFGLNVFFAALLVWAAEKFRDGPRRFLLLTVFVWALGLGNQQTLLLLAPALAWLAYARRGALDAKTAAAALAVLLAGLSIYACLYLRSRAGPVLNWEEPGSWERFWKVVSRARYGSFQLAQGTPSPRGLDSLVRQTGFFAERLFHHLGAAGCGLLLVGLAAGWNRKEWGKHFFYLAAFLAAGPLFLFWAGVAPSAKTTEMLDRFLLLPLAVGAYFLVRAWTALVFRPGWPRRAAFALAALWAGSLAAAPSGAFGRGARANFVTEDHARNVLRTLPPAALLIADRADETEFALCHRLAVARARPDVEFVDANAGVTPSRYGPDYYEIWGGPRLARRLRAESAWIASAARPVYYASLDLGQIDVPRRAAGLLFAAKEPETRRLGFPFWEAYVFRGAPFASHRDRHLLFADADVLGRYAQGLGAETAARHWLARSEEYGAPSWRLRTALWHQQRGRRREAEALYRQLLQRSEDQPLVWNDLGVLCMEEGRLEEALDCYRRAVASDAKYAEAYYNMGVVHWRRGNWAAVAEAFGNTLKIDPAHNGARRYFDEAVRRRERTAS